MRFRIKNLIELGEEHEVTSEARDAGIYGTLL